MAKIQPISWQKFARVFELDGWKYMRTRGDHLAYVKRGFSRPVIIPRYPAIPVFIIQNNLKTAHISRARYFELLKQA